MSDCEGGAVDAMAVVVLAVRGFDDDDEALRGGMMGTRACGYREGYGSDRVS
jgi:hypothetical protein